MSLPLAFRPEVREEVDEIYAWYERKQTGLGEDFLAKLDEVFTRLEKRPEAHSLVFWDVRRALTDRFPYGVFYQVKPDKVLIIAVMHNRRDPALWQSRVQSD